MRMDWVVWIGCVLLFCAGLIWAAVPISNDFFVVDNVHDFFEIVSAAATAGALILAASSINAWRSQFAAQTDHEHAKKALLCLFKYRDEMKAARSPVMFQYEMSPDDGQSENAESTFKDQIRGYQRRLDKVCTARAALYSELSECEVIWGGCLKEMLIDLFRFESEFKEYVRLHFLAYGGIDGGGDRESFRMLLQKKRDVLYGWDDEFEIEFLRAVKVMEDYLRGKLVK